MHSPSLRGATLVTVLIAMLVAACGDPLGLPQAANPNTVDTVRLFALSGTPVATPSGFRFFRAAIPSVAVPQPVRTDQSSDYDFAFEIDTTGRALLLPTAALRLGPSSGGQLSTLPFDSIRLAPDRNYELDSALVLDVGSVAILQSRLTTCGFGIGAVYHYYAKLRVLTIDLTTDPGGRYIDLEILVDTNCGYRGLELGLPSR